MAPLVAKTPQLLKEFVGREIGVSEWFQVTHERIEQFAEATEDRQWIHLDRARAGKESPYGATIAHGFLTLSLISHFVKDVIAIQSGVRLAVNYGLNRVRFPSAVRADSKIRATFRAARREGTSRRGGSDFCRDDGNRKLRETGLRCGVDRSLLLVRHGTSLGGLDGVTAVVTGAMSGCWRRASAARKSIWILSGMDAKRRLWSDPGDSENRFAGR